MRIAVISDIHGNKYALNSVLKDINKNNVDVILSTGDLVGYLPHPNEVIKMVREERILSVQGNHDQYVSSCKPIKIEDVAGHSLEEIQSNASVMYTNMVITPDNREYLRNLPKQIRIKFEEVSFLLVHGSPRQNNEYLYEHTDFGEIMKETDVDVIICGHTHIPFHKKINHKHIINAGSVGKPKHGNHRATYVILDINNHDLKVGVEEVEYELDCLINDIKKNHMISDILVDHLIKGY